MQLYKSQNITSGPGMGFDPVKGGAFFEYKNKSTGQRHQVSLEDPRSVHAKAQFAFGAGLHGVAFWRGNELYGLNVATDINGSDSPHAQALWRAASPDGGGYGGRGFHHAPLKM